MNKHSLPLGLRAVSALLLPVHLLTLWPAQVWSAVSAPGVGKEVVALQALSVPPAKRVPSPFTPRPISFSRNPKDKEITAARIFSEPLLPIGGKTSSAENADLAQAILEFERNSVAENTDALTGFLKKYPESPWRVSLQTNLGILFRQNGYWTRALSAWNDAWQTGKDEQDPTKRLIVDQAISFYAELIARFGRVDELSRLVEEVGERSFRGPATERFAGAKSSLHLEKLQPTKSFRCGPFALGSILRAIRPNRAMTEEVYNSVSTANGTSLSFVKDLSQQWGMDFQMAKRQVGAKVITPCVVHWKKGHYAALVKELPEGRYLVQDPTFTDDIAVTSQALDEEGSGYYLVAAGALPDGWNIASREEGDTIWGKGQVPPNDPPPPGGDSPTVKPKDPCSGMADWNVDPSRVNLMMQDTPLSYAPPVGPSIDFGLSYSQREVAPAGVQNYSNAGPKWSFSWVAFVVNDTTNGNVKSYGPSGGERTYTGYVGTSSSGTFATNYRTAGTLIRTSAQSFEYVESDGSRYIYGLADTSTPKRIYLTEKHDPQGNKITYSYNADYRLAAVTDALGQVTTLTYMSENVGDIANYYKVHEVTDWAGRKATVEYDVNGQLWKITDTAGITSQFTYKAGTDFIEKLTTPYGDTLFTSTDVGSDRLMLITDPTGAQEKVVYKYSMLPPDYANLAAPSAPGFLADTSLVQYRNSYYWDKKAYAERPDDYAAAHLMHWLHTNSGYVEQILESEKRPMENRVYYNYPGQSKGVIYPGTSSKPSKIARKLDDGTTQLTEFEYNARGFITKRVEPLNPASPVPRTTFYEYAANGVDLLSVYKVNPSGQTAYVRNGVTYQTDKLAGYAYNGLHDVLTATDVAGQITTYTYNSYGQALTVTNAKNETTKFTYDRDQNSDGVSDGYLKYVDGPVANSRATFGYDGYGRLNEVVNPEGYTVLITYEAIGGDATKTLNRPNKTYYGVVWNGDHTSFTHNGYDEVTYNLLNVEWTRDRKGRWSRNWYDANRHLIATIDPLFRVTQYERCLCGSLEAIIDPAGNRTTWFRDVQGRVTDKVYADNRGTHYEYEGSTSRLKSVTDAKGQVASYTYCPDNRLQSVTYSNSTIATPPVSYTYDPVYGRVQTIASNGITEITYTYNPITAPPALGAGRVATVDGSLADDTISYTYDELGRVLSRSIADPGTPNTASVIYDVLGRVTTATNLLGTFNYQYVGLSGRVDYLDYPNGQRVDYDYWDAASLAGSGNGDFRLKQIKNTNQAGTTVFSQFDYEYDPVGQITKWTRNNSGLPNAQVWTLGYDDVDQLTSGVGREGATNALQEEDVYRYDLAGNRTAEQMGGVVTTAGYNSLNQLKSLSPGGLMLFGGTVNEDATITLGTGVEAQAATVDVNHNWSGRVKVTPGSNSISVAATDADGLTTNKTINVTVSGNNATFAYDRNGNLTDDGQRTYEWDAKNQLVAINYTESDPALRTEFSYDSQGRRTKILEKSGGTVTSEKQFVWVGLSIAEERDGSNLVTKQFCGFGESRGSSHYFYTLDHLGSLREVVDDSGAITARYEYGLYGKRTRSTGIDDFDFGFTGHYHHVSSGLCLTAFRAYSADLARWISRDPIAEEGGLNLYAYVQNSSVNLVDPFGKNLVSALGGALSGALSGAVTGAVTGAIVGFVASGFNPAGAAVGAVAGATAGAIGGGIAGAVSSGVGTSGFGNGVKSGVVPGAIVGGISGVTAGLGAIAGTAGNGLTHFGQASNAIASSGQLGTNASSALWATTGAQWATTVPGQAVPIVGAAADAFAAIPSVGPWTAFGSAAGFQSAGSGILNLTTGVFLEGGGINLQLLTWIAGDAGVDAVIGLFWGLTHPCP